MDAEQAWQSALGQLQMEMPKASFDTWVRDTRLVSYDDGRFTIGVRNAYARDWLENRLASTVTRLLMGMMNRSVDIQFVVHNETVPDEDAEPETSEDDTTNRAKITDKDDDLEVEARYELAYDEIVTPDHVTVVPGYFRRHLRVIGADLGWLYLGFRQSAFNSGGRSGSKRERFSGKTIAALSGIGERTFWNWIGKTETWERLRGLVSTSIGSSEWDTSSTTPRRLPRRYTVSMTLPLTAADARSLRTWLTRNVERLGGPEQVVEAAAEVPLDELLPPSTQVQEGDYPESVPSILRSMFDGHIPSDRQVSLVTRLQKHIMPDNDRLGVTHFFVEHILPHLGTGPGWILTLLRERCYFNRETGEIRDKVTVQGGYAEIGGWIGVAPDTIKRWMYGKHSASRGRSKSGAKREEKCGPGRQASEIGKLSFPVLSIYLRETTAGKVASFATSPRSFDVLLDEIPVEILEAALNEQADQALTLALDDEVNPISEEGSVRAVCSIGLARFAVSSALISARFAVSESPIRARFADDSRAVCSIVSARFADDLRAVCRVFKSLNHLNPITNNFPSPLPPSSAAETKTQKPRQPARGSGNQAYWDFNFLMANNQVAKALDIRRRQKQTGATIERLAQGFVSWLLYAYSPAGQRVDDPVALAAARLLKNVSTGAGGDLDRLAQLRPFELKALFDQDFAGTLWEAPDTIEKEIYGIKIKILAAPHKRELYRRLFGGNHES